MTETHCLYCENELSLIMDFDTLSDKVICPKCNNVMEISYEETWDGEEEDGWFYLEKRND
jgi:hypothetical protein